MTDAVLVTVIGSVGAVVTAVLKRDLGAIHVLVNSNLTEVKQSLAIATTEISSLRGYIDDKLKDIPDVSSTDLVPPPPGSPTPPSLPPMTVAVYPPEKP